MDEGWFDWDEGNEGHVLDPMRVAVHVYNIPGERRRGVVGAANEGRILFVVYTIRDGR